MRNFDSIQSLSDAEQACHKGLLRKVLLLPVELGGTDMPENVVFVPDHAAAIKDDITLELLVAVQRGMINVSIVPEYRGNSFVPTRIIISAARDGGQSGLVREIAIW